MDRYCGHENFDKAYLTNISIIQGVSFAFFAQRVFEIKVENLSIEFLLHSLVSFFIIVAITYVYTLLVIRTKWKISALDFLIPYTLGISEIAAVSNLYKDMWWFWNGVLCFFAFLAYCNTLYMIVKCKICNREEYEPMTERLRINLILTPILCAICFFNYFFPNYIFKLISILLYFISILVVMSYKVGGLPSDKFDCKSD